MIATDLAGYGQQFRLITANSVYAQSWVEILCVYRKLVQNSSAVFSRDPGKELRDYIVLGVQSAILLLNRAFQSFDSLDYRMVHGGIIAQTHLPGTYNFLLTSSDLWEIAETAGLRKGEFGASRSRYDDRRSANPGLHFVTKASRGSSSPPDDCLCHQSYNGLHCEVINAEVGL